MEKTEAFFDSILTLSIRLPVTFFRLIFQPGKAFDPSDNCPASVFFSFVILSIYTLSRSIFDGNVPNWFNQDSALITFIAYFSLLVKFQQVVLTRVFRITKTAEEQMRAFFYPITVLIVFVFLGFYFRESIWKFLVPILLFSHAMYLVVLFNVSRAYLGLSKGKSFGAALIGYLLLLIAPISITIIFHGKLAGSG